MFILCEPFYTKHNILIILLFKRVHREFGRDKVLSAEPTWYHFSERIQNEYFSAIEERKRERKRASNKFELRVRLRECEWSFIKSE